ncbi:MAG: hypothetical protein WC861_00645 [Candidatus Micrarchaeia archaeon]|jgi:hypothetical protein
MSDNETLGALERKWESTCKLIFGSPIGRPLDFEDYLYSGVARPSTRESETGEEVVALMAIPQGARVADYASIMKEGTAKAPKVSINDVKDIDSLSRAMGEVAVFAGNVIQGQSSHVGRSNRVLYSHYIYSSHNVVYSKYVAFSRRVKYSESVFGVDDIAKIRFALKSNGIYEASVLFECLRVYTSSNCYYCANMDDSHDCLFSFNQRGARRKIGNLELPADRFSALKGKLLGEMREALSSKKRAVSVLEIIGGSHE